MVTIRALKHARCKSLTLILSQIACPPQATGTPTGDIHTTLVNTANGDLTGLFIARALLSDNRLTTQHIIDRIGHIAMDNSLIPTLLFHHHLEGRWRFALLNTLLSMATARLFVTQSHR